MKCISQVFDKQFRRNIIIPYGKMKGSKILHFFHSKLLYSSIERVLNANQGRLGNSFFRSTHKGKKNKKVQFHSLLPFKYEFFPRRFVFQTTKSNQFIFFCKISNIFVAYWLNFIGLIFKRTENVNKNASLLFGCFAYYQI